MEERITIDELVDRAMDAMRTLGFAEYSVWSNYASAYSPMKKYFHYHGICQFDVGAMDKYHRAVEKRFSDGEIGKMQFDNHIRAIERVTEVYLTGKLEWALKKPHIQIQIERII